MSKLSILSEFWEFLRASQKVLVGTNSFLSAAIWHSNSANRGHRYSAVYLYCFKNYFTLFIIVF